MSTRSIVEYFAEHEAYRCGYCHSDDTNYSHGMWAHKMTVEDYQQLIDRGWRRSGCYVYKPTMDQTCCPQYPIRCKALEFRPSKSHKKIIKRVNRFLNTGIRPGRGDPSDSGGATTQDDSEPSGLNLDVVPSKNRSAIDTQMEVDVCSANSCDASDRISKQPATAVKTDDSPLRCDSAMQEKSSLAEPDGKEQDKPGASAKTSLPRPGEGPDPNKPRCRKAKELRKERKLAKLGQQNKLEEEVKKTAEPKSLEDLLNEVDDNPVHTLEIQLVRSCPESKEFTRTLNSSHDVYYKYQLAIHRDKPDKPVMKQYKRFLCNSPLEIKLLRSGSDDYVASLKESHRVFSKYQMQIHKEKPDDCDMKCFTNFLVETPLEAEGVFGSFHQHYLLDGELIAVGVLDILPHCVSSVYLYYHPDYQFLSLGNYSALREISLTRELHRNHPSIECYYMGFYIHSCPKMRYKGNYFPSYLNCPVTYNWVAIEEAGKKLDVAKFSRLADMHSKDEDGTVSLDQVLVLCHRQSMPYCIYKTMFGGSESDEQEVLQYSQLVGSTLATRMLLFRKG